MVFTKKRIIALSASASLCLVLISSVHATPLWGSGFAGAGGAPLFDVDPATGQASNPRPTGIDRLVGIAFAPGPAGGTLYGLSNSTAAADPNSLFSIDPATGTSQLIGATGLTDITEGDLACDPTTGTLYGVWNLGQGRRQLFTVDTETGAASVVPGSLLGDPSGMAFDAGGTLFVIDTSLQELSTVDKVTGQILTTVPLSEPLGSTAGMDVDPATGTFYIADGGSDGTDMLYTLHPSTGVLTEVGPLGVDTGLAGLAFVPEPVTALLLAFGAAMCVSSRCRRPSAQ